MRVIITNASCSPFASKEMGKVRTVSRLAYQLALAGNVGQLRQVIWGSAVVEDLNLFNAALCQTLHNLQSFMSVAREHIE